MQVTLHVSGATSKGSLDGLFVAPFGCTFIVTCSCCLISNERVGGRTLNVNVMHEAVGEYVYLHDRSAFFFIKER